MSQNTVIGRGKKSAVSKLIAEQRAQMDASGKYHVICVLCGQVGPLFATKDLKTGKMVIKPKASDKWPVMLVAADGKNKGKLISATKTDCPVEKYTTVRICPKCNRARMKEN